MSNTKPSAAVQAPSIVEAVADAISPITEGGIMSARKKAPAVIERLRAAGYVIVPILPATAMRTAGSRALLPPSVDFADECWRVMVEASR